VSKELDELKEEHGAEDGYFADFEKINKASVSSRIKEIKGSKEDAEELSILTNFLTLSEQESEAKRKIKEAEKGLETKVVARYKTLSEKDIKALVVDDKWMAAIESAVKDEMDRINHRLTGRIKELAERYALPLPTFIIETALLREKVDDHLKKMGFVW
jgi:type I restriction enzyme M protein